MQNIDFLPSKYREASAERRTRYYGVLVMAAFFSLLAVAFAGQCALRAHVERELDQVRDQYNRVLVHSNRLAALQRERIPCDAEAQLDTLLRQPWPRTQILAGILAVLPEPITLVRLRVDRQAASGGIVQASLSPGAAVAGEEPKLLPTERDLRRLKQESQRLETVVDLEGITDDALTLHTYLGKLASLGLFSAAELTSIDRLEKSSMSRFRARLVVRPGHVDAPAPPASPAQPGAGLAKTAGPQPQRNSP